MSEHQTTIRDVIDLELCLAGDCNVRTFADRLEAALHKHIRQSFLIKRIDADNAGWNHTWALKSLEADLTYSRPKLRQPEPPEAA